MADVSFLLNGRSAAFQDAPGLSALQALRDRLGTRSPKDACSPQGVCGCCTVIWNDRPIMACTRPASALEGARVTTLEGLDSHRREVLARAFAQRGGLQCGYCTPGIALRAAWALDRDPAMDRARLAAAIQPHLCRCTGWVKVLDALEEAARHWTLGTLPEEPSVLPRYDAHRTVLGERPFVDDLREDGMLHGALRLSDHPRARVLAIDPGPAQAMPGVRAVLLAPDVPGARKVGLLVLDWPVLLAEGEVTHCLGTPLAAVAADTREVARAAAAAIRVDYEVLEPVTDPVAALAPGSPLVHADRGSNLLGTSRVKRGDVDAALAASAHVLTETFRTQRIEHAFLETECCLAVPQDDGTLLVHSQGQGVHDDRRQIAALLGWSPARVRVRLSSNGGAFGGKEDLSVQGQAALLAVRTGRPVKLALSREQSMVLHPKRHPIEMRYTVACDAEGRLAAVRARMVGDSGAYASVGAKVLERAAGHSCGPYKVPAVDVEAVAVYTNNAPSGAMRGFGVNQAAFAIEGMLDRLAEKVGIDGWDIRERNVLGPGDRFGTGQVMGPAAAGMRRALLAVRDDYKGARHAGVACGIKNTGIGNGVPDIGRALIRADAADHVTVLTGFTEMGQGLFTVLQGIVCDTAGLRPEQVSVVVESDPEVECGMTTASRATLLAGEATRRAAEKLRNVLDSGATLADLEGRAWGGEVVFDFTVAPETEGDDPVTHVTFGYAAQVVVLDDDGRVRRVVAAHDVGRVMNRTLCEAQIQGAVHMGLGYALTEDFPWEGGSPRSLSLHELHLLRAKDVPDIEVRLLEVPDPLTPLGVKGVGEIGLVPTAPAVASALHARDGIWRTRLPMRGSPAARALLPRRLWEEDHP